MLNCHVLTASDGREALEILERQRADPIGNGASPDEDSIALVLSDLVMPGMGGTALTREIRRRGLAVRMVLTTGHLLEEESENLGARGMTAWVTKPVSLEQLAQVVSREVRLAVGRTHSAVPSPIFP